MSEGPAHQVRLTVRCEQCGAVLRLRFHSDHFLLFNQSEPTFLCRCGKSYTTYPGAISPVPEVYAVDTPHWQVVSHRVWECRECHHRWRTELEGEAQDVDLARR